MPATGASRQAMGLTTSRPPVSVAAIAFFEPLVAAIVIPERLPEPGLIVVEEPQPADPLGAFPEVASGDDEPRRSAVLGCQRLAVVLPRHERLAVEDVPEREVRGVAAVGEGDDERG